MNRSRLLGALGVAACIALLFVGLVWRSGADGTAETAQDGTLDSEPDDVAESVADAPVSVPSEPTSPTTAAPESMGPAGAMMLPAESGLAGSGVWLAARLDGGPFRWYAAPSDRPETGPYLQVLSYDPQIPDGMELECTFVSDLAVQVALADGSAACLDVRSGASGAQGRIGVLDSSLLIIISGNVTDPQLLEAAVNLAEAPDDRGFVVGDAGLPVGVSEVGVGFGVSDFAVVSAEAAAEPVLSMTWSDEDGRLLFYVVTRESPSYMINHRFGFESVTDVTVRGVPGFVRAIADQPDYRGVVWQESGLIFQVGSQQIEERELLDLVERMRPATESEWDAMLAKNP